MAFQLFRIYNMSAHDLEDVRKLFAMRVYAAVSISDNSSVEKMTPADESGGSNPSWDSIIGFGVAKGAMQEEAVKLVIKLFAQRTLGDRYIGKVEISLKELYAMARRNMGVIELNRTVIGEFGNRMGQLNFSCRFRKGLVEPKSKPHEKSYNFWKIGLSVGFLIARILIVTTTGEDVDFSAFVEDGIDLDWGEDALGNGNEWECDTLWE